MVDKIKPELKKTIRRIPQDEIGEVISELKERETELEKNHLLGNVSQMELSDNEKDLVLDAMGDGLVEHPSGLMETAKVAAEAGKIRDEKVEELRDDLDTFNRVLDIDNLREFRREFGECREEDTLSGIRACVINKSNTKGIAVNAVSGPIAHILKQDFDRAKPIEF